MKYRYVKNISQASSIKRFASFLTLYCVSKTSCPSMYSKILHIHGQDFSDKEYDTENCFSGDYKYGFCVGAGQNGSAIQTGCTKDCPRVGLSVCLSIPVCPSVGPYCSAYTRYIKNTVNNPQFLTL